MSKPLVAICSLVLSVLFIGCANLGRIASDSRDTYDFRKTRWGFTQAMVLLAEQGKRMHRKTENVVIFNHSMDNIRCKIVYTFKDHKLRAAGYITDTPVKGAQNIIKRSVVELGEPTQILNDGMLWITENTLIYSNAYISRIDVPANPEYQKSGGILSHLLQSQQPTGEIRRWDGVWAYIDQDFFREINEASHPYPLDALSFHEKLLFGVLKRYPIYNYLNQIQLPATPR